MAREMPNVPVPVCANLQSQVLFLLVIKLISRKNENKINKHSKALLCLILINCHVLFAVLSLIWVIAYA